MILKASRCILNVPIEFNLQNFSGSSIIVCFVLMPDAKYSKGTFNKNYYQTELRNQMIFC